MVATIRHEFTEAVSAYEEKPREQYLMEFPAQVCGLTVINTLSLIHACTLFVGM